MTTTAKLTLQEFLAMEEEKPYREFIDGVAVPKPMPGRTRVLLQRFLVRRFRKHFGASRSIAYRADRRCIVGPDDAKWSVVPDFLCVSEARNTSTENVWTAPELIAEIVSKDESLSRLAAKVWFYASYDIRMVWLIDPFERTITVLAPEQSSRTLRADDVLDGGAVVPRFSVTVADVVAVLGD